MHAQIIFNITVQKKQLEFPEDTPANFRVGPNARPRLRCSSAG